VRPVKGNEVYAGKGVDPVAVALVQATENHL
jgi:hypothetical protein